MTLDLAARLAVLLACAVAVGALYMLLAAPAAARVDPAYRQATPPQLAGLGPVAAERPPMR